MSATRKCDKSDLLKRRNWDSTTWQLQAKIGKMTHDRLKTLRELYRPKLVRYASLAIAAVAGYDAASNQFGLPTIRTVWGVSGSLLPWWGWLLALQAVFVYALFDYVRRLPRAELDKASEESSQSGLQLEVAELRLAIQSLTGEVDQPEEPLAVDPIAQRADEFARAFSRVDELERFKLGLQEFEAEEAKHWGWVLSCAREVPVGAGAGEATLNFRQVMGGWRSQARGLVDRIEHITGERNEAPAEPVVSFNPHQIVGEEKTIADAWARYEYQAVAHQRARVQGALRRLYEWIDTEAARQKAIITGYNRRHPVEVRDASVVKGC